MTNQDLIKEMLITLKKVNTAIYHSTMKETILHAEVRSVIKKASGIGTLDSEWNLSRKKMPDFDGMYYVYGFMHHPCGNVTPFHKIVECRMNQWVKSDPGEQMTYWQNLLDPPSQTDHEREPDQEWKNKSEPYL